MTTEMKTHIDLFCGTYPEGNTRTAYQNDLDAWASWLPANVDWLQIDLTLANQYRDWLVEQYAGATVARKLGTVHTFYKFLNPQLVTTVNPFSVVKKPKEMKDKGKRWLSSEETANWREVARRSPTPTERLAGELLMKGMRPQEVIDASWEHITDRNGAKMLIVQGKTGTRAMKLTHMMHFCLNALPHQEGNLLRGVRDSKPWSRMHLSRFVKRVAARARIPDPQSVCPRVLRRSVGMVLYEQTGDLIDVQIALDHAEITTTMSYVKSLRETETELYEIMDEAMDERVTIGSWQNEPNLFTHI